MGIVLGLFAALAYGAADFVAGVGSRRLAPGPVALLVQIAAVVTAVVGVLLLPGDGPTRHALAWGALAGVGSGVGTLALYRGMTLGAMSPVATCSAVLAAVLPALVGLATGDRLSLVVAVGIIVAVPAIAMVAWQGGADGASSSGASSSGAGPSGASSSGASSSGASSSGAGPSGAGMGSGLAHGAVAGLGFGLLFIAFDRAGTASGAWPLVPSASVGLLVVIPFARGAGRPNASWRTPTLLAAGAGVLSGISNLLFLRAAGIGQLAVVAVLTSLYPAATVILARVLLHEVWTTVQAVGLVISAGAVVLISLG